MKTLLKTLLTVLLLYGATGVTAQETRTETLRSGGVERTYRLHLPANLPDNAPLVIVLHGYGGDANPEAFGMNATADRHGFAVCYPQGERDSRGKRGWNVGYPSQAEMPIDDVQFLEDLIGHLHRHYGLSRRNVFCTGMSNGGDMCYLLAAQRPDLFAALGPVAGFMSVAILREDKSLQPVPLFEIHGTADPTTRWKAAGAPISRSRWPLDTGPPKTNASNTASTPCHGVPTDCKSSHTATRAAPTATKYGSTKPSAANTRGKRPAWTPARNFGASSAATFDRPPVHRPQKKGSAPHGVEPFVIHRPAANRSDAGCQFAKVRPLASASIEIGFERSTSPARIRFERSLTT